VDLTMGSLKGTFLYSVAGIANNVRSCQIGGYQYGFFFSDIFYDTHGNEGWSVSDSSVFIVDYGFYAELTHGLNISGCTLTPCGYNCVKIKAGVSVHVVNSYLEGDNKRPFGNNLDFSAIDFGPGTTSCSVIGNQISGTGTLQKGYIVDGDNHSISFNRFNFETGVYKDNLLYGNGHSVFSNIGKGSEKNAYSNGFVKGQFNMHRLQEFTDNAAALLATLKIGDIYRTGDLLKIVH
jgi:hypothetical protein